MKPDIGNFNLTDIDAPTFTHTKQFEEHFNYIKSKLIEWLDNGKEPVQGIKSAEEILEKYSTKMSSGQYVFSAKRILAATQAYHEQFNQQGISKEGWNAPHVIVEENVYQSAEKYAKSRLIETEDGKCANTFDVIIHCIAQFSLMPSSPSSSKGDDKVFTLQQGLDIWKACADYSHDYYNPGGWEVLNAPEKEDYFKQKFDIDIDI